MQPASSTDTLSAICELLAASERDGKWNVRAVITTNFDDLLEEQLEQARIPFVPHYTAQRRERTSTLPILHIHGYLPNTAERWAKLNPEQDLIFAEDDYHQLTYTPFHWSIEELTHFMRTSTILFIGCSMRDPNVRRLLDATSTSGSKHHFVFRRRYRAGNMNEARTEVQARAMRSGVDAASTAIVERAIEKATQIALQADERTFAQMGVGIIWFEDYSDVADYLRRIPIRRLEVLRNSRIEPRPLTR